MQNVALHWDAACLKGLRSITHSHLFSLPSYRVKQGRWRPFWWRVEGALGRWSQQQQRCRRPYCSPLTISRLWDGRGDRAAMGPDHTALLHLQPPHPFWILPLRATGFLSSKPSSFQLWTLSAFTQPPSLSRGGCVSAFLGAQYFVGA